jgi:photosystem II stability/assembly factor-like uncharacterized protein
VLVSNNNGATWHATNACRRMWLASHSLAIASDSQIMIASREGAFRSADGGATWEHVENGLPGKDITSVSFDSTHHRLLATSDATGVIFESTTADVPGNAVPTADSRCAGSA